jgi:hypothetical protein
MPPIVKFCDLFRDYVVSVPLVIIGINDYSEKFVNLNFPDVGNIPFIIEKMGESLNGRVQSGNGGILHNGFLLQLSCFLFYYITKF